MWNVPRAMMNDSSPAVLRLIGIRKRFGGVEVLKGVDFDVVPGEVHALLGQNGAGKSTLVKIIAGAHPSDAGEMIIDGRSMDATSPALAQRLGISVMYQETSLYGDLSVMENLFVGRYPRSRIGTINWKTMEAQALRLWDELGIRLPLRARLATLSKSSRQLVEIAKALLQDARLIIMDEPTASLTAFEVERLFKTINDLRRSGRSIIYISHRMDEIQQIADRFTVLRDGERAGGGKVGEVSPKAIIGMMLGRDFGREYVRQPGRPGRPVLEIKGLSSGTRVRDVSLTVHSGEVVALAGLLGSGRSEVARATFGLDERSAGEVKVNGIDLPPNPMAAVAAGIGLVPEDRGREGLVLPISISRNLSLPALWRFSRRGLIARQREIDNADSVIRRTGIVPPLRDIAAGSLSGGNQQKVAIGKWLALELSVLIIDEPTQGVDVAAKAEIHRLIGELVDAGLGVLLISSDLEEVVAMADRTLVMRAGSVIRDMPYGSRPEEILAAAGGAVLGDVH
jgi:rhamnose transport system ATP-binding protein